jgi:phosphoadenosine phosphosulfate reductase
MYSLRKTRETAFDKMGDRLLTGSMTDAELGCLNETLEEWTPVEILQWAAELFDGQIILQTSMQRRGSMLMHMLSANGLSKVPALFVDTGYHFVETLQAKSELEARYGIRVVTAYPEQTPEEQTAFFGEELWRDPETYRLCCDIRKERPFVKAASKYRAVISGLQRSEGGARADVPIVSYDPRLDAYIIAPLAVWPRHAVDDYNDANDVYLHPLLAQGYPSIGCATCTTPVREGEDDRAGRWRHIREARSDDSSAPIYCNINWVDRRSEALTRPRVRPLRAGKPA